VLQGRADAAQSALDQTIEATGDTQGLNSATTMGVSGTRSLTDAMALFESFFDFGETLYDASMMRRARH
jgi:hypothetical protein